MRPHRLADVLLGSIVTLLTAPTGLGAAVGGWLAGRHTESVAGGALAGGLAGALGSLPWVALVYAASAGTIDPVGYHEGGVHVGINAADPALLAPWQAAAVAGLVAGVFVAAAALGGLVAGYDSELFDQVREDLAAELRG